MMYLYINMIMYKYENYVKLYGYFILFIADLLIIISKNVCDMSHNLSWDHILTMAARFDKGKEIQYANYRQHYYVITQALHNWRFEIPILEEIFCI